MLFLVGSALVGVVGDLAGGEIPSGAVVGGIALVVVGLIVAGAIRRRQETAQDVADDGAPTPTEALTPLPSPSPSPQAPPPQRSTREVRSGPRSLATEPEDPEAKAFKARLADAVKDLADNVEEMPSPGEGMDKRLTSEEMIARAKKRIAEFRDD